MKPENLPVRPFDRLFAEVQMTPQSLTRLKHSYAYFLLSAVITTYGGYCGGTSFAWKSLFSSWTGWALLALAIYIIPKITVAARRNPWLGAAALGLNGFLAGFIMAPLAGAATYTSSKLVAHAGTATLVILAAVTVYVLTRVKSFEPKRGISYGAGATLAATLIVSLALGFDWLSMVVSMGAGMFGVVILVSATSELLKDQSIETPVSGALELFLATFNIFLSAVQLAGRLLRRPAALPH
ncbi:MAG: Bax inhibitor-1/YccA family protein [Candidatus Solibacter usitatus]|nr:Bax inhibitor-1/YccA family protein [Candidatus Solibacter usitatus]